MKVKGTDEIFGGYNPIGWDKPAENIDHKNCNEVLFFHWKMVLFKILF